ncbi:MAG: N-acetylmuramoyl-L-alanine amidase [Candidatus Pacebacteria bacterium]|jgi:hypothetical protein|nr:N-acetylmuramoyl-L-alanine amidase [Candidatus Paceibacterota bacterium]
MKKLLLGIFTASFLLSFFYTNAQNQTGYSLEATTNNSTISVTLNSPPYITKTVQPIVSESSITTIPTTTNIPYIPTIDGGLDQKTINPTGKTLWTVQLKGSTTYYIRIIEISGQTKKFLTNEVIVKTGSVGEIFFDEAKFKKIDTGIFTLSGNINKEKHRDIDPVPLSSISVSASFYDKKTKDLILQLNPAKPNNNGGYDFSIKSTSFNQNTFYNLKVSFDSNNGAHSEHTYTVDTGKGYIIPETGEARDNFFDKNSYRLLAPIPGMTALLDPALCQSEQYKNPGVICDINAFLNFLLSLAIGAAAVVLVVKIIISGYGYMTSDIPFVKARLKSGFVEALIGLVVALSAYLILNTINPRLVNNDVKVGVAEFSVDEVEDYNYSNEDYKSISTNYGVVDPECPQKLGSVVGEGVLDKPNIKNKICSVIEGGIITPKGITIHGTAGTNNSDSVLKGWITNNILWKKGIKSILIKGKSVDIAPSSAHFIVDKDGAISQTVRINRRSNHCGKCQKTGSTNTTSISIEIVMACVKECTSHTSKAVWENPTNSQVSSTASLINYLLERYPSINKNNDIYVHGEQASNRTYNEGRNTLDAVIPYLK